MHTHTLGVFGCFFQATTYCFNNCSKTDTRCSVCCNNFQASSAPLFCFQDKTALTEFVFTAEKKTFLQPSIGIYLLAAEIVSYLEEMHNI